MNDNLSEEEFDDMLPEYDFSGGVRGKYAEAFQQGYRVTIHKIDGTIEERDYSLPNGVVKLDPDVQSYFPDAESVNSTLRSLIELIPARSAGERAD